MIVVEKATFRYGDGASPVLRDIRLEIRDGEHVAVVGPNGCGKTTLLRLFNGLLSPETGSVVVDGLDTRVGSLLPEIRRRVGMIFQIPDHQLVGATVEEDVAFGPENLALAPEEIRRRVDGALARLGIQALARRDPHTLSGGEKRLVAIAGALAMEPRYLACDEPTAYLDPAGRRRILEVLDSLHAGGVGIVHVTHRMNDIREAERVIVLDRGAVVLEGPPREIFRHAPALEKMNLEIPQITELMQDLARRGLPVRPDVLTAAEAGGDLLALFSGQETFPPQIPARKVRHA